MLPRFWTVLAATGAVVALPAAAIAAAKPQVVARHGIGHSGVSYALTAEPKLVHSHGERLAPFTLRVRRAGDTTSSVSGRSRLPLTSAAHPVRAGMLNACAKPSTIAVYALAVPSARRLVATLQNGRRLELKVSKAPAAWRGVMGANFVGPKRPPVRSVSALDGAGHTISTARFHTSPACAAGATA